MRVCFHFYACTHRVGVAEYTPANGKKSRRDLKPDGCWSLCNRGVTTVFT